MNYDEGREEFNRKDYNQLSVGWSEVESVRRSINNYKERGDKICLQNMNEKYKEEEEKRIYREIYGLNQKKGERGRFIE